jgi:hypothetical protein
VGLLLVHAFSSIALLARNEKLRKAERGVKKQRLPPLRPTDNIGRGEYLRGSPSFTGLHHSSQFKGLYFGEQLTINLVVVRFTYGPCAFRQGRLQCLFQSQGAARLCRSL